MLSHTQSLLVDLHHHQASRVVEMSMLAPHQFHRPCTQPVTCIVQRAVACGACTCQLSEVQHTCTAINDCIWQAACVSPMRQSTNHVLWSTSRVSTCMPWVCGLSSSLLGQQVLQQKGLPSWVSLHALPPCLWTVPRPVFLPPRAPGQCPPQPPAAA